MSTRKASGHAPPAQTRLQGLHVRCVPILAATRVEIIGYPTSGWNSGRYLGAIDLNYPLLELPAIMQSVGGLGDELMKYAAYRMREDNK